MGGPGQPGLQGGRPQRTGTTLGQPQGEYTVQACVVHLIIKCLSVVTCRPWGCVWSRFHRTETIWHTRKCPVHCGTTTSSTSSKRSVVKNSSSGVCPFIKQIDCLSCPSQQHAKLSWSDPLWLSSGFWNYHRTSGNSSLTLPSPQNAPHLRMGTSQTAVPHLSSMRTVLRFPLIVLLHRLLQSVPMWDRKTQH